MEKNREKKIWDIFQLLRGYTNPMNTFNIFIKLLFLSYITTYIDLLEINNIDSYKKILEFKRKFDAHIYGDQILNRNDIYEILDIVDQNLNKLDDFNRDLDFLYDDKNTVVGKNVLVLIASLNDGDNNLRDANYREIIEFALEKAYSEGKTDKRIRRLAQTILEVDEKDSVLNPFGGYSTFALEINPKEYVAYDVNSGVSLTSALIQTILGRKNYKIKTTNFYNEDTTNKFDKIFSDFYGFNTSFEHEMVFNGVATKSKEAAMFYKIIESLKEKGKAAILVPGKVLFASSKSMTEMRKVITNEGLKAIISIPAILFSTPVKFFLVILEKGYSSNIVFIDAEKYAKGDKLWEPLSPEQCDEIASIYSQKKIIKGISSSKTVEEVLNGGSWLPSLYIETSNLKIVRSTEEIDKELNNLYSELTNLLQS